MTPAEHRAEAERLLDEWQEMGTSELPSAAGQWLQDREHFIACAQVHALLAGPPPPGITVTTFAGPPTIPVSPTHHLTITPAQTTTSAPAAATQTGGRLG